jgi:fumarate reductase subunit D
MHDIAQKTSGFISNFFGGWFLIIMIPLMIWVIIHTINDVEETKKKQSLEDKIK